MWVEGWISELESSAGQAGGKEVGKSWAEGVVWDRMEVLGSWGHISHLFTLMTLQTTNSIHTLELEGRQRQRDRRQRLDWKD